MLDLINLCLPPLLIALGALCAASTVSLIIVFAACVAAEED